MKRAFRFGLTAVRRLKRDSLSEEMLRPTRNLVVFCRRRFRIGACLLGFTRSGPMVLVGRPPPPPPPDSFECQKLKPATGQQSHCGCDVSNIWRGGGCEDVLFIVTHTAQPPGAFFAPPPHKKCCAWVVFFFGGWGEGRGGCPLGPPLECR